MSVMHRWASVFLIALGLVAMLTAGCSSGSVLANDTVATGSVTCTNITGTLAFSPPLTMKGNSPESTAITLVASGCTTTRSNVSSVTRGLAATTISSTSNSCSGLLSSRALTIKVAWTPATISQSVLTFSSYSAASSPSGGEGFTLPKLGGTAKVTGSFPGPDHGSGSVAATFSDQTATQLLTACGSSVGLASIRVTSGNVTLK
jgi:hypothetical protein